MKEMGIRTALGATRFDIARLVVASGAKPILLGLFVGLAIAAPASRALQQVLPVVRIDARDPLVFAATAALLALVACAAMFGPARRAAAVDPIQALRQD
jgi:putative ABC transport system permease protein